MNRKIEEMRLTLFETAQKFGINATETIRCSQELDILLNGCRSGLIRCEQTKDPGGPRFRQIDSPASKKTLKEPAL